MAQLFGIARLGRDAELKYTANSDPVIQLALAFEYGKKQDGKRPTQWVDASIWGKRAESLAPYLLKGQQVSVTIDDVHIRTYEKGDGTPGFALSGRVSNIEFAGSPPAKPEAASQPQAARQQPKHTQAPAKAAAKNDDFDDDIPF
jgi:single-strand DNA-binding protein